MGRGFGNPFARLAFDILISAIFPRLTKRLLPLMRLFAVVVVAIYWLEKLNRERFARRFAEPS